VASTTASDHQPSRTSRTRPRRVRIHQSGSTRTARDATAFTAPSSRTAPPERIAAPRSRPGCTARSGRSTHGARAIGQISELIAPSPMSIRGASA
jgi:hypothetical protein